MATQTGDGFLRGQTKNKSQYHNTETDVYMVRDAITGQFTRGKKGSPYKNVRKE